MFVGRSPVTQAARVIRVRVLKCGYAFDGLAADQFECPVVHDLGENRQGYLSRVFRRGEFLPGPVAESEVFVDADKDQLDQLATTLQTARGYILAVTGGTDSVGDAQYNYQLSNKRADAVVNYLATKYNIPPHKFYLIGIGKDNPVADNHTRDGRAQNRRVEIKLMSNMDQSSATPAASSGGE